MAKSKVVEPEVKKKSTSVLAVRPPTKVEIINSEFISDAKNIIVNLIMSLPEREIKPKGLQYVLKQYIYVKQSNSHQIEGRQSKLYYNDVLGGVTVNSQNMLKLKS